MRAIVSSRASFLVGKMPVRRNGRNGQVNGSSHKPVSTVAVAKPKLTETAEQVARRQVREAEARLSAVLNSTVSDICQSAQSQIVGMRRGLGVHPYASRIENREEYRYYKRWILHKKGFPHRWRRGAKKPRYKDLRVQSDREYFIAGLE